ncbi:aminoglycoside phosphotransferase family protein [Streptomyces antimicrobicus]|uniref:Aminoglycoside phosphotransferase family protein n=1 Tax=Streptomyces antimicrobicus TaxID=2883108 RepID=A0ABS8BDN0_9ACTN|nr:aminoglycoside phosphotransferase family protein [Streptomyces antimicrobicus]MCB5182643.1 aminoglycoside phosphotransferase family protein [Streptomyces antimicrobicus]
MDALALYEKARAHEGSLAGFYHHNVRVDTATGPVLVRTPGSRSEPMDLTLWPEPALLEAIRPYVSRAPRLLYAGAEPEFQIHEFVEGRLVHDLAPDAGARLPGGVVSGVTRLFGEMLRVPGSALPALPSGWPAEGDTKAFALRLLDVVRAIRDRADGPLEALYQDLGVPADPCALLAERAGRELSERPFRLLHADLHRKNMILTEDGVVFIDWELALWGDPVYDLADHLHKTGYSAADRSCVLAGWHAAAPAECRVGWSEDMEYYLAYEAMKSAVVDTVRWGRRIAKAPTGGERLLLAEELRGKLLRGGPHWGGGTPPEVEEIVSASVRRLVSPA